MIKRYRHKPEPHFHLCKDESLAVQFRSHPDGLVTWDENDELIEVDAYKTPFYGVEIEVESKNKSINNELWKVIQPINELNFYIKTDSSLQNGLELVSHPRSYKSWLSKYDDMKKFFALLRSKDIYGCRARCGFHIHIGYDAFMSISHIAKFLKILCELQPLILAKEGRTIDSINQFCIPVASWKSIISGINRLKQFMSSKTLELLFNSNLIEGAEKLDHHSCITPTIATIEIRFFKGTTSAIKFYRSLALLESIRIYAAINGFPLCTAKNYIEWVSKRDNKLFNLVGRKLKLPIKTIEAQEVFRQVNKSTIWYQEFVKSIRKIYQSLEEEFDLSAIATGNTEILPLLQLESEPPLTNCNIVDDLYIIATRNYGNTVYPITTGSKTAHSFNFLMLNERASFFTKYLIDYFKILIKYKEFFTDKTHITTINKFEKLSQEEKENFGNILLMCYTTMHRSIRIRTGDSISKIFSYLAAYGCNDILSIQKKEISELVPRVMQLLNDQTTAKKKIIGLALLYSLLWDEPYDQNKYKILVETLRNQISKRLEILGPLKGPEKTFFENQTEIALSYYNEITEIYSLLSSRGINYHIELAILWAKAYINTSVGTNEYNYQYARNTKGSGLRILLQALVDRRTKPISLTGLISSEQPKLQFKNLKKKAQSSTVQNKIIGWPSFLADQYTYQLMCGNSEKASLLKALQKLKTNTQDPDLQYEYRTQTRRQETFTEQLERQRPRATSSDFLHNVIFGTELEAQVAPRGERVNGGDEEV